MDDTAPLARIEHALGRLRRNQLRRGLLSAPAEPAGTGFDPSLVPVLYAVEEGVDSGLEGVTVGLVAERIGLDPSRASRMVGAAIEAGYLERVASQTDGRRIHLRLTEAGTAQTARCHQHRQAYLAQALSHWSARDRADLAKLFDRFTQDLSTTDPC